MLGEGTKASRGSSYPTAIWGNLRALTISHFGEVIMAPGDFIAFSPGKLEIGYTAVIRGKVSARTVAIAKGAIVDGEIEVTSDTPVMRFEEKRDAKADAA